MLKLILLLLAGVVIGREISGVEVTTAFSKFMKEYDRQYASFEELRMRYELFEGNYRAIEEHNLQDPSLQLAINHFADRTQDEIKQLFRYRKNLPAPCMLKHVKPPVVKTDLDWRTSGCVPPIKSQGNCGSCWAFSATTVIEIWCCLHKKTLVLLSEQELVDCSRSYGNEGCNGGWMNYAFEYVKDKGLSTEVEYPYEARDRTCRKKSSQCMINGCVNVTHNDNDMLLEAANYGGVSVAVKANNMAFMYYRSGIIKSGCGRESDELDHGVVIVGAAGSTETPYWIVQNSWGRSWGQMGYVYILRNTGMSPGVCGIAMEASYPQSITGCFVSHTSCDLILFVSILEVPFAAVDETSPNSIL